MKIFVTGVAGQLGHDVMNELAARGIEGIGSDLAASYSGADDHTAVVSMPYLSMDITDEKAVSSILHQVQPDAVIHCAAWTAVDAAEDEDKRDKVAAINAGGTRNIASVCRELGCKMMYISTDYVFDGQGTDPWEPDCKAYAPLNVYGKTKLDGELAVSGLLDRFFIVRIAWVFGTNGKNFINTMLRLGKTHDTLRIVSDQIGTPTYTPDLARLLTDMIQTDRYGYYHATNAELPLPEGALNTAGKDVFYTEEGCRCGYISWYDFSCEIFRQAAALGYEAYGPDHLTLIPVSTSEYGASKALRPFNSRLDKSKLLQCGFSMLPDWQDALRRYLDSINIDTL